MATIQTARDARRWTIAYRKPRANRFVRKDLALTWHEAQDLAGVFMRENPGYQTYYTTNRQAETDGYASADDAGNIMVDSGRRVRIVEETPANAVPVTMPTAENGITVTVTYRPECRNADGEPSVYVFSSGAAVDGFLDMCRDQIESFTRSDAKTDETDDDANPCDHVGRMCSAAIGDCLCACAECAARRGETGDDGCSFDGAPLNVNGTCPFGHTRDEQNAYDRHMTEMAERHERECGRPFTTGGADPYGTHCDLDRHAGDVHEGVDPFGNGRIRWSGGGMCAGDPIPVRDVEHVPAPDDGTMACPECGSPLDSRGPFDGRPANGGPAGGHAGFGDTYLCANGHWFTVINGAIVPPEHILTVVETGDGATNAGRPRNRVSAETFDGYVSAMMAAIHEDMEEPFPHGKWIPRNVGSFGALHDYCDANGYAAELIPYAGPSCTCGAATNDRDDDHTDACAVSVDRYSVNGAYAAWTDLVNAVETECARRLAAEAADITRNGYRSAIPWTWLSPDGVHHAQMPDRPCATCGRRHDLPTPADADADDRRRLADMIRNMDAATIVSAMMDVDRVGEIREHMDGAW